MGKYFIVERWNKSHLYLTVNDDGLHGWEYAPICSKLATTNSREAAISLGKECGGKNYNILSQRR